MGPERSLFSKTTSFVEQKIRGGEKLALRAVIAGVIITAGVSPDIALASGAVVSKTDVELTDIINPCPNAPKDPFNVYGDMLIVQTSSGHKTFETHLSASNGDILN